MLVIDDLQWGDIDSASILQEMLRPPDAPPLLLVVAYRSEDAAEARLLRALSKSIRDASQAKVYDIEVGPLSDEDARQLAFRLTTGAGDAGRRSESIARESGGNAFFVHELAQHSVTLGGETTLDGVIRDRVDALPEAARLLLRAVALSVQSDSSGYRGGGRRPQEPGPGTVAIVAGVAARSRRTRRTDTSKPTTIGSANPSSGSCRRASSPDGICASPRHGNSPEPRGRRRWSRILKPPATSSRPVSTRWLPREKAQEALAFDRAADFYALLVRVELDDDRRREWLIKLGEALANAGRGYDASTAFLTALNGVPADQAIELERRAACELIRAGYLDEATEVLERLFPKVNVRPPGTDRQALLSLLGYRLLLALRGTRFRERSETEIAPEDLRRIDVLTSISPPLCLSSVIQGNALNVQAMWHALRAGEPRRVLLSLTTLAVQTGTGGAHSERRAQDLIKKAQSLAVRLQDPWATGRTVLADGIVLKLNGHWKQGAERLRQAIDIFGDCRGVPLGDRDGADAHS